jgi:hypothetical protein
MRINPLLVVGLALVHTPSRGLSDDGGTTTNTLGLVVEAETIPGISGNVKALKARQSYHHDNGWFDYHVNLITVYLPDTGRAWTGPFDVKQLARMPDGIWGFSYTGGADPRLRVTPSTNSYPTNLNDLEMMLQQELEAYRSGRGRYSGDPSYFVSPGAIWGHDNLWLPRGPDVDGSPEGFEGLSAVPKPSRLAGVAVEGTNAVVTVEIGTNLVAQLAFSPQMVLVWASTNGVRIGPLSTNTVSYYYINNQGRRIHTLVY